jgi:asparagine synthase (glutamine-hydrolysing)
MAKVTQQQSDNQHNITTCSIGFDDEKFNETEFAQIVAEQYHTNHHEFTVHQNVKDNLEHIVSFFDEPFADPSLVPTYFVSELARQKVTVAVAGDGGDEVFAGYEKYAIDYQENKFRNKFPQWLRSSIFPSLAKLAGSINATPFQRAKSLLTSLSVDPAMGFYITNSFITDEQWQNLVNDNTRSELVDYHPSTQTIDKYNKADGQDHLSKILYTDMKTYLPGGILVKVDRMSMANSLEVRAPILDYEVVEAAAKLPSSYKFKVSENNAKGEKKHILKELFKPMLPDDILYRKKMGFAVPLATWLREELKDTAQEYLLNRNQGLVNYFKPDAIQSMWSAHQSGQKDYSSPLWSMLMFQMWWDKYMDPAHA